MSRLTKEEGIPVNKLHRGAVLVGFLVLSLSLTLVAPDVLGAAGTVTFYTGTGIDDGYGIVAGPDGALWFTNHGNSTIGRITTAGVITSYTDPSINLPQGIAAGPDGALWFANNGNNSIGRITTAGNVTNYTYTGPLMPPIAITVGPDGALWFTASNSYTGLIGRITTAGAITTYTDA